MTSIDSHLFEFYWLGHRRDPEETALPLAEGLAVKIDTSWWVLYALFYPLRRASELRASSAQFEYAPFRSQVRRK